MTEERERQRRWNRRRRIIPETPVQADIPSHHPCRVDIEPIPSILLRQAHRDPGPCSDRSNVCFNSVPPVVLAKDRIRIWKVQ